MCGLLAVFQPQGVAADKARHALALMRHRGPDAQALWINDDRLLALGHARLKILDLSDSANQPMHSPDGRYVLIFNGEIVNFRELRQRYRGPWNFRTQGDSEVLLAYFVQQGIEALHQFVGMFAFALFDREERKLHVVRDRFGIKPIYTCHLPQGGFAFASEIAPLLHIQGSAKADPETIRTYLETGRYDAGARTFFSGVTALPPGCYGTVDLVSGAFDIKRWYDLEEKVEDLSNRKRSDLIEQGSGLVEAAVRDHLVADVPVGLNVSGGVDSSVLVRAALRTQPDLHVFTQDYPRPYSELEWVRKVSDGTHLHCCTLSSDDILAVLSDTVRAQAEPFGGVTVAGYDAIYEAAREQGITVLLDGNGIDEVFLGYDKYLKPASDNRNTGRSIDGSSGLAPDAVAPALRSTAAVLPETPVAFAGDDVVRREAARDLLSEKIPRGLRFNDRMSMKRSRELRVPFLDHRLVEFGFGVPTSKHLSGGHTKSLFREIAERFVPKDVAWAPKRSVQSPQREWLADEWHNLVEGILTSQSFRERGWIDPDKATSLYEAYRAGGKQNSFFVWQWINLELWARECLDARPA